MQCRDPAGMSRVPGFQKVEGFRPANLADNDPVRPEAKGRAHKILQAGAAAMGSELNHIQRCAFELARVFENDNAIVAETGLCEQRISEGRLAGGGPARDQNVGMGIYGVLQRFGERRRQCALIDIITNFKGRGRGFADREAWGRRDGWEKPFKPLAAAGEFGRDDGGIAVCRLVHAGGHKADDPLAVGGWERVLGNN